MRKHQCHETLSLSQPPSVGPTTGATTTAMPYSAKPCPRLAGGNCGGQNRLGHRRHPATGQPLHDAEDQQRLQIPRKAAEQRTHGEQRDADKEKTLAAEHLGDPAAGAQDDRIGDKIGGDHPRCFVRTDGQTAGNVAQRDIRNRGVQHFHERRDRDEARDQPRIRTAIFGLVRVCGFGHVALRQGRTVTVGTTDIPGPISTSGRWSKVIFTGTRCTTLT